MIQTRDGYLWVGTRDGLARFDGVKFTVFQAENNPGLEAEAAAGCVVIGTEHFPAIRCATVCPAI